MAEFTAFIRHLLETGEARLRGVPAMQSHETAAVVELLGEAYADHALDVAGPALPFAPDAALSAARFLAWSCWFLVHRREPPEVVESHLMMAGPRSASDHLSADLLLRFAPAVHRRARAIAPQDILTRRLTEVLRAWPLSGALADLTDPPTDLGEHPGLLLLFAERLATKPKPAWLSGSVLPYAELVFARRGMSLPALPLPAEGIV